MMIVVMLVEMVLPILTIMAHETAEVSEEDFVIQGAAVFGAEVSVVDVVASGVAVVSVAAVPAAGEGFEVGAGVVVLLFHV